MTTVARWQTMWRQLGASTLDDALFSRLIECYSEPHRAGRRKILQEFVNRESIYSTEYFRVEYEAQAHSNIARSLARL